MQLLCALLNYLISIHVNTGEDMPLVELTLEIGNQGHVHSVLTACDIQKKNKVWSNITFDSI